MKIKNLLSITYAVSFVALSLVGCSDYDNGFTAQQISFIRDFKSIYGEVDPTQDWNLAERAKVTVTTSTPSDIKIYAKTNGVYSLVGHYSNVSGTQTLGFDVIEGTTEIMVSNGSTAQYTTVGNSVTFNSISTRGIIDESDLVEIEENYLKLDYDTYTKWKNYVPEGQYNLNKVIDDFIYVSTGEFTFYPIYWNTSDNIDVYLYYYDDNDLTNNDKRNDIHIYTIKSAGDEIQTCSWIWKLFPEDSPFNSYTKEEVEAAGYIVKDENDWDANGPNQFKFPQYRSEDGTMYEPARYSAPDEDNWKDVTNEGNYPYRFGDPAAIQTQGIKINLEEGTIFGIYIVAKIGGTFYSNSARNTDIDSKTGKNAVHACTFEDSGYMYLGFEDCPGYSSGADFDLNDCMFVIDGALPAITSEDGISWIISAEDLGNTLDIDYNDVVLQVQYISGEDEAYVTPLAAGGTLASYVYFVGADGKEIPLAEKKGQVNEIHQLFGVAGTESGNYAPINVDNDKAKPTEYAPTIPVPVGTNFTLATSEVGKEEYDGNVAAQMGGFKIKVLQQGQTAFDESKVQTIQNSTAKGDDNVPYVICTPKTWTNGDWKKTGHYRWPRESVPMLSENGNGIAAYGTPGHSFAEWVADKTKATDWFAYPYTEDDGSTFPNTCAPGFVTNVTSGDSGSGGGGNLGGLSVTPNYEYTYTDAYNNSTTYKNGSFISLQGVDISTDKDVILEFTFSSVPSASIYWILGTEIKEDYGNGYNAGGSIEFTATQYKAAKEAGGIYVYGYNDPEVNVTYANIKAKE